MSKSETENKKRKVYKMENTKENLLRLFNKEIADKLAMLKEIAADTDARRADDNRLLANATEYRLTTLCSVVRAMTDKEYFNTLCKLFDVEEAQA
jgi:uncharacterized protein YacL (UPF0231 family)